MEFQPGTVLRPPSSARIRDFEKYCRETLPPEFVNVLKTGNGGTPVQHVFFQGNRDRVLERFLCLLDDYRSEHVHGWYDMSVVITQVGDRLTDDPDVLGTNVIPIGALFGGDLLCLDFRRDKKEPCVSVWDHELSEMDKPHLEKVAGSFREFVDMLQSGPEERLKQKP